MSNIKRPYSDFFKWGACSIAPILIGGQAVNVWADRYRSVFPELLKYRPFLSGDIDFYGSANDVRALAVALNAKPVISSPRGIESGFIEVQSGENESPLRYEFLRQVNGLSLEDCEKISSIEVAGITVKILVPPVLLKAKLANLCDLDQSNRNDLKHLEMSILCTRAFLLQSEADLSERSLLKLYQYTKEIVGSRGAMRVEEEYGVEASEALPAITEDSPEKLQNWAKVRSRGRGI